MIEDNDKLDEILRNAALDYNRPPDAVPRDEMWAAIEAAQTQRTRPALRIVVPQPRRTIQRYTWLGLAAAAGLLIATGVGIGRWSTLRIPASGTSATPRNVASNGGEAAPSGPETTQTMQAGAAENGISGQPSNIAPDATAPSVSPREAPRGGRGVHRPAVMPTRVADREPSRATTREFGGSSAPATGGYRSEVPYQVATIRHLTNAEALLTAFRTDSRDAKMDAQLSVWARDLLSNTRLLLDSPAADDPQRARLLGDLELVLAEIVQLSPGASAQDRGLIEGSIRNGQVMTRLRSAIPAGPTRGL